MLYLPGVEMKRKSSFSLLDASVRHKTHSSGGPAPWFPNGFVGLWWGSRWDPLYGLMGLNGIQWDFLGFNGIYRSGVSQGFNIT